MTQLFYVAHPVAPPCVEPLGEDGDGLSPDQFLAMSVMLNAGNAKRWLAWLYRACPSVALVCPWLPLVEMFCDDGGKERERGLRDCEAVAGSCDGIILVGGRVSGGMALERDACANGYGPWPGLVIDLTHLGPYPPADVPAGLPWPIEVSR